MVATNQSLEAAGGVQQVAGRRGAPLLSQSLIIEKLPDCFDSINCGRLAALSGGSFLGAINVSVRQSLSLSCRALPLADFSREPRRTCRDLYRAIPTKPRRVTVLVTRAASTQRHWIRTIT
jgi:hypothetical protein